VAKIASIWNVQFVRLRRPDELECVAPNFHVPQRLGDLGHVAGDALAARTSSGMVGVLLYGRSMRPVLRIRTVTP
jgi:hypothetical protein